MGYEKTISKEHSQSNLLDSATDPSWKDRIQARYVLTLILFIGSAFVYALRVNLNIAIVAMIREPNATSYFLSANTTLQFDNDVCPFENENEDEFENQEEISLGDTGSFDWSPSEQGTILGGFYYGYLSTQLVGGRLSHHFGPRLVYGGGILLSSLLTLLTPLAANWHIAALVALRVLIGLAQGISVPAIYCFVPFWYTTKEVSTHLAIIMTGNHVGNIFAMPIAGYLCDHGFAGGWPSVFYLFGGAGCLYCIVLFAFVSDKPDNHPWISEKELTLLQKGRGSQTAQKNPPVPWKAILTSVPVFALSLTKMTSYYAYHVVLTKIPAYLDDVLHFSVEANGMINALLYTLKSACGVGAGFLSDLIMQKKILSSDPTRKIFQAISLLGMGLFMALIPLHGCDTMSVIVMLGMALFMSGFNCGGDYPAPSDMAPVFSGTIFGIINTYAAATGVFAPLVVGIILDEKASSLTQWSYVFYSSGAICVFGILVFILFGSAKLQPWATPVDKGNNLEDGRRRTTSGSTKGHRHGQKDEFGSEEYI